MSKYLLQQKKMIQARMEILLKHGFFASVAMMKMVPEDKMSFIAATDGKTIVYNPIVIQNMSNDEVRFVLFHELMHCILLHHFRRKNRDPQIWNIACDYAVNSLLYLAGLVSHKTMVATGALRMDRFDHMMAEEIYDILMKNASMRPRFGSGKFDDLKDYGYFDGDQPTQTMEEYCKNEVKEVLKHSQKCGNLFLQDKIKLELNKIDAPWYLSLLNMIQDLIRNDYSWATPSPRYVQHGVYLPNTVQYGIRKMAFAIDTSGSMSPERLDVAVSHIKDIVENIDAQSIDILQCNTNLTVPTETLTPGDINEYFKDHLVGYGGTNFAPVFKYYDENPEETPSLLIYHTDLDGPCDIEQPAYPVFWIVDQENADRKCEFGTKVVI